MMIKLYNFQERAIRELQLAWTRHRRVSLVSPTGSGKTVMGRAATQTFERVLWVAHREELVRQAGDGFPVLDVGYISPAWRPDMSRRIQIGTVQSILSREAFPPADLVVLDESRHYAADDWRRIAEHYPSAKFLGLDATPERADGLPMSDIFDAIVIAAQPSELLNNEPPLLVKPEIIAPDRYLDGAIAQDPVESYLKFGSHDLKSEVRHYRRGFIFAPRVHYANEWCDRLSRNGVKSRVISDSTTSELRASYMAEFRSGRTTVLLSVSCLTEGIDVPQAEVCVLARAFGSPGAMIQATGRVTRTHPHKSGALIIDLPGATQLHGDPMKDRPWSLDGHTPKEGQPQENTGKPDFELEITGDPLYYQSASLTQDCSLALYTSSNIPDVAKRSVVSHENCERCGTKLSGHAKKTGMCMKCLCDLECEKIRTSRATKQQEKSIINHWAKGF